jgi:hypothetical protein
LPQPSMRRRCTAARLASSPLIEPLRQPSLSPLPKGRGGLSEEFRYSSASATCSHSSDGIGASEQETCCNPICDEPEKSTISSPWRRRSGTRIGQTAVIPTAHYPDDAVLSTLNGEWHPAKPESRPAKIRITRHARAPWDRHRARPVPGRAEKRRERHMMRPDRMPLQPSAGSPCSASCREPCRIKGEKPVAPDGPAYLSDVITTTYTTCRRVEYPLPYPGARRWPRRAGRS